MFSLFFLNVEGDKNRPYFFMNKRNCESFKTNDASFFRDTFFAKKPLLVTT